IPSTFFARIGTTTRLPFDTRFLSASGTEYVSGATASGRATETSIGVSVILSEAKDLLSSEEVLRFAQDDELPTVPGCQRHAMRCAVRVRRNEERHERVG